MSEVPLYTPGREIGRDVSALAARSRPAGPIAILSYQPPPYPTNRHPILPTAGPMCTRGSQEVPWSTSARPQRVFLVFMRGPTRSARGGITSTGGAQDGNEGECLSSRAPVELRREVESERVDCGERAGDGKDGWKVVSALESIGMLSASSSNHDQEVSARISIESRGWLSMDPIWSKRCISTLDVDGVVLRGTAPSRDALYGSTME